jgi:hypothetical protein
MPYLALIAHTNQIDYSHFVGTIGCYCVVMRLLVILNVYKSRRLY